MVGHDVRSELAVSKQRLGLRLAQACIVGLALGFLTVSVLPPHSYTSDLQQEYLTASAYRDGIDVFTPVAELSARYFPYRTENFPHANPHPPFLALLSVPLTYFPFPAITLAWLLLNVLLVLIVGRCLGLSVLGSLALTAWPPLFWLLLIGQLELAILFVIMLAWADAARGRDWRAGAWLGAAAAVKFYPALLLGWFLIRSRFRLVAAAGAVFVLSQLGNLATIGWSGMVRYYDEILPAVSARYVSIGLNSSPYGALLRLFGGASDVLPLIDAPHVVVPLTVGFSLLGLVALLKLRPQAGPVAILVTLPLVWYYYAVLALPQIAYLLRNTRSRYVAIGAVALSSFALPLVNLLLSSIFEAMGFTGSVAPPWAGLLTALQPAGFVALLVLSFLHDDEHPRVAGAWAGRAPVE